MPLSKEFVESAYDLHAKNYDFAVKLYRLIGLNIEEYRLRAVELLQLKQGDFVLDIGCGTGLNFGPLIQRIGPKGRIIGVDLSSKMLACAKERIKRSKWNNVELVHSDITSYHFPEGVNGAISTGVFGYVTGRDKVIETISHSLVHGGRLSIVDGKRPTKWPLWLFKLFVWFSSPFGITQDYFNSCTWESVERHFQDVTFEEYYGGLIYICSGMADLPPRIARKVLDS